MKKLFILLLIVVACYPAYSQDCCDKVEKQAVKIYNLEKLVQNEKENNQNYQIIVTKYIDTNRLLKAELKMLEQFKDEKKSFDTKLAQKSDSIELIKQIIVAKDRQILVVNQECEKRSGEEKEKGRNDALMDVIDDYNKKNFDTIILFSTRFSVQRDLQLVGSNNAIKELLLDLKIYFDATEILTRRYDALMVGNAVKALNQMKRQSSLLEQLKKDIGSYNEYRESLFRHLSNLCDLDKRKSALNDPEIEKIKFKDVAEIMADYLNSYPDYKKYPFLSDIVFDIFRRKAEDSDNDITDLLNKVQNKGQ